MWVFLYVGLSVSFAQSQEPMDFEGAEIQGELNQADLSLLGQRTPWVIPVPLKPPTTMGHHLRLPVCWPVLRAAPALVVAVEAPPAKKRKRNGRR